VLIYPLSPGSRYSGTIPLCRVIGAVQLSVFERFLVERAFKFRHKLSAVEITVADVLDDIKAEAMMCLQSGESKAFSDVIDELAEVYSLVIEASICKNSAGDIENYARVSRAEYLSSQPLYKESVTMKTSSVISFMSLAISFPD
jgi:hypothetical protein